MKMTVSFPSGKPVPQLSAPGLEPRFAAGEDFWRIHLDTDEIRELTVFSADQAPPQVSYSNDEDDIYLSQTEGGKRRNLRCYIPSFHS